jgi:hypothetical protein
MPRHTLVDDGLLDGLPDDPGADDDVGLLFVALALCGAETAGVADAAMIPEVDGEGVAAGADLEVVVVGGGALEEAEAVVHTPYRSWQPAPQWSADVPHQPYLGKTNRMAIPQENTVSTHTCGGGA